MNKNPKGLGRGLGAIFEIEKTLVSKSTTKLSTMEELDISLISPNPKQPRTYFDEDALEELADSITTLGVIQPITVKKESDQQYILISGERRWRASKLAGLKSIPAYIREVDDQNLHEMALVENIQRQDLNAIEVALSLQRLIDECELTQDMLASRVGKKRSTIANYMRLLKLPVEVQLALQQDLISMGHAKAIASAQTNEAQLLLLKKTLKKSLSVRQLEEMAKKLEQNTDDDAQQSDEQEFPHSYIKLVEQLEKFFSQNISIKQSKKGGGKIVIDFETDDDISEFVRKFESIR